MSKMHFSMACFLRKFIWNNPQGFVTPPILLMFISYIRPFMVSSRLHEPDFRNSVAFSSIMALFAVELTPACLFFAPQLAS
jgi:hypothetical protein